MDLVHGRILAETAAVMVDETGPNRVVLPYCFNSSYPSQCYFAVSRQWILQVCHLCC